LSAESVQFQLQFIFLLSIAVLLGMAAQGAYEFFGSDQGPSWKRIRKLFIRPLVVSPIVLLIFLSTVDLSIGQWKQALLMCLLAFQAGFCWQKTMEKSG